MLLFVFSAMSTLADSCAILVFRIIINTFVVGNLPTFFSDGTDIGLSTTSVTNVEHGLIKIHNYKQVKHTECHKSLMVYLSEFVLYVINPKWAYLYVFGYNNNNEANEPDASNKRPMTYDLWPMS